MHVRRCDPATAEPVKMVGAEGVRMQVMAGRTDGMPNFSMRHFVVEPGGCTPHHSHPYEHEVYVIEGGLEATCGEVTESLCAGDVIYVPSGQIHQFVNTSNHPARFLCMVPLESDCGADVPGS